MAEETLFDNTIQEPKPIIDPAKKYADELVGEGKKFATVEDLARSVLHKDDFIEQLKSETGRMRKELESRANLDAIVDKLVAKQNITPPPSNDAEPPVSEPKAPTSEDLKKMVREALSEETTVSTQRANMKEVKAKLLEKYGTQYVSKLAEVAGKLQTSTKTLDQLAATNPVMFWALVDGNIPTAPGFSAPARTEVRSEGFKPDVSGGAKTQKQWNEVRKKMGSREYWTPKVQNQIWADAKKLGEAFND